MVLIKRHPEFKLNNINIEESSWSKILFKCMGFRKSQATTGKMCISEELKKEVQELYLQLIAKKIEQNQIPPFLVINLSQTLSRYVHGCNKILAEKGSKTVSIASRTDKRMMTTTLAITLSDNFLPIHLINGGK